MISPTIIGERLLNLRTEKNVSREEEALAVGVSSSAVAMYETGRRIPRDTVKLRIAEYFGESIESIFFAQ